MSLLSLLQKGGPAGAGAGAGGSGDGAGASGGGAAFGTVLSGSHHTVRTSDAAAVTSLPVNPITVAKFAPGFYRGKLVAANAHYRCYAVKQKLLRVVSTSGSDKGLFRGHVAPVVDVAFLGSSCNVVASVGEDGTAFVWHVYGPGADGALVVQVIAEIRGASKFSRVAWHPYIPTMLALQSGEGLEVVQLPDYPEGVLMPSHTPAVVHPVLINTTAAPVGRYVAHNAAHPRVINDFVFCSEGRHLVAACQDGSLVVWGLQDWAHVGTPPFTPQFMFKPYGDVPLNTVRVLPYVDAGAPIHLLVGLSDNAVVQLFQLSPTFRDPVLMQTLTVDPDHPTRNIVEVSPDGHLLFVANTEAPSLVIVQMDTSRNAMRHAVTFALKYPVLSLLVHVAPVDDGDDLDIDDGSTIPAVDVFTVQTGAVQHYAVLPSTWFPPLSPGDASAPAAFVPPAVTVPPPHPAPSPTGSASGPLLTPGALSGVAAPGVGAGAGPALGAPNDLLAQKARDMDDVMASLEAMGVEAGSDLRDGGSSAGPGAASSGDDYEEEEEEEEEDDDDDDGDVDGDDGITYDDDDDDDDQVHDDRPQVDLDDPAIAGHGETPMPPMADAAARPASLMNLLQASFGAKTPSSTATDPQLLANVPVGEPSPVPAMSASAASAPAPVDAPAPAPARAAAIAAVASAVAAPAFPQAPVVEMAGVAAGGHAAAHPPATGMPTTASSDAVLTPDALAHLERSMATTFRACFMDMLVPVMERTTQSMMSQVGNQVQRGMAAMQQEVQTIVRVVRDAKAEIDAATVTLTAAAKNVYQATKLQESSGHLMDNASKAHVKSTKELQSVLDAVRSELRAMRDARQTLTSAATSLPALVKEAVTPLHSVASSPAATPTASVAGSVAGSGSGSGAGAGAGAGAVPASGGKKAGRARTRGPKPARAEDGASVTSRKGGRKAAAVPITVEQERALPLAPRPASGDLALLASQVRIKEFENAFSHALNATDVNLVVWLASLTSNGSSAAEAVAAMSPLVRLCLFQQMARGLEDQTALRLVWLLALANNLDMNDEAMRTHGPAIVKEINDALRAVRVQQGLETKLKSALGTALAKFSK